MTAILDLAKQLGQALASSEEYTAFKKAQTAVEGNLAAQYMLRDFRTRQYELERARLAGNLTPDMVKDLQEKAQVVAVNPVVREFLEAEARFGNLMMDVQRLLGEAVGIDVDNVPGASGAGQGGEAAGDGN